MKIFEWVDENWEKCEYMYFLSNKGEFHKMKVIDVKLHSEREDFFCSKKSTITDLIEKYKMLLNDFIDTIPFSPTNKFALIPHSKYNRHIMSYFYFKCRKSWFWKIFSSLGGSLQKILSQDDEIYNQINKYLSFHRKVVANRYFNFNPFTWQDEEGWLGRITNQDIQQGNEILKKVIAYLEDKVEKENSV
jgi:hypothetical protein